MSATEERTGLTVTLPLPPSTNHLFATVRGRQGGTRRVVTRDYQAWREAAGWAGKPWPRLADDARNRRPWALALTVYNLSRRRDLSNTCKAVEDLIVTHTGLRDSYTDRITLVRRWGAGAPRVVAVVTLLDDTEEVAA